MRILVTGGAGFIMSHLVKYLFTTQEVELLVNLDVLTEDADWRNIPLVFTQPLGERYKFVRGDICNQRLVEHLISEYQFTHCINGAAWTFVDDSLIEGASLPFSESNGRGVHVLLEAFRQYGQNSLKKFVQVSTDEVYGDSNRVGIFDEDHTVLDPTNPYAVYKLAGERIARSYFLTYGLPTIITRGGNTYGPNQHPKKLIAMLIALVFDFGNHVRLPLYGDGSNRRHWMFVTDHCRGITAALHKDRPGGAYNIGGGTELSNLEVAQHILKYFGLSEEKCIKYVEDRKGHDENYAMSIDKAERELDFQCQIPFSEGILTTCRWYKHNLDWLVDPRTGKPKQRGRGTDV